MHVWDPDRSMRCPKTTQPGSDGTRVSHSWDGLWCWVTLCQTVSQSFNLLFPDGSWVRNLPANAEDTGDAGSIPGSGRSPGEGNDNTLQHSCLENPMDREAWRATVQRAAKSQTPQGDSAHTHGKTDSYAVKITAAKTLGGKDVHSQDASGKSLDAL